MTQCPGSNKEIQRRQENNKQKPSGTTCKVPDRTRKLPKRQLEANPSLIGCQFKEGNLNLLAGVSLHTVNDTLCPNLGYYSSHAKKYTYKRLTEEK